MGRSLAYQTAPRMSRRRLAYGSALAGLALGGVVGLGLALPPAQAQLKSDAPGLQTPYGRAPLTFADIVDRVKPAVVSIHVTNGGGKIAMGPDGKGGGPRDLLPDLPDDHPLSEFFKRLPPELRGLPSPNARPTLAQGSGFVISADGYVVTNNHVIDGASKIQVSFDQDRKFEAELVGTDQRTDVALLKIKSGTGPFHFVKFAENAPRVGDWVLAVGNPFGLGGSVTAGIVSALGRDINAGPYDYMQIDAAVNRGNSGGPTFNLDGDVVGVNTAIYSPSGGNVGIAFAIPARTASEVVGQLKSSGSVRRGWLGVKIQNIDEDTAASLGLGEAKGALVTEVTTSGPAAEAGLKNGDAILAVNGQPVADSRDLARQIAGISPNAKVDVKILRGQKEQVVPVKLGTFPSGKELAKVEESLKEPQTTEMDQLGLTVAPGTGSNKDGVVVTNVDGDSDAAQKGIKSGDVILEVGGLNVKTPDDVANGVKEATKLGRKAVLMRVKSGSEMRFVAVQLKMKKS
jgi:serine protease Do